jgi:hypothetical protein
MRISAISLMDLKRGVEMAVTAAVEDLKKRSKKRKSKAATPQMPAGGGMGMDWKP